MTKPFRTEVEELDAAARAIGRKLEDIEVHDDREGFNHAPASHRYQATWGAPDLDCLTGDGPTPQAAIWDLIEATDAPKQQGTCLSCRAAGFHWDAPKEDGRCYQCGGNVGMWNKP